MNNSEILDLVLTIALLLVTPTPVIAWHWVWEPDYLTVNIHGKSKHMSNSPELGIVVLYVALWNTGLMGIKCLNGLKKEYVLANMPNFDMPNRISALQFC